MIVGLQQGCLSGFSFALLFGGNLDPDPFQSKKLARIKVKIQELLRLKIVDGRGDAPNGDVEAQNRALEGRPVVADSKLFDEKQDPDPDSYPDESDADFQVWFVHVWARSPVGLKILVKSFVSVEGFTLFEYITCGTRYDTICIYELSRSYKTVVPYGFRLKQRVSSNSSSKTLPGTFSSPVPGLVQVNIT